MSLKLAGKHLQFPTEENLREFLLASADQFRQLTGMPFYEIGQRALNDPAFLGQVEDGRNIKIRTFESFMLWLDARWPADSPLPKANSAQSKSEAVVSHRARALVREQLKDGPRAESAIRAAAGMARISPQSLIAAASVLGVRTQKGQWWLPG